MSNWPRWVLAGVLATLTMDLGSTLVRLTGWTAGLPPPLMGRWFTLLAHGQFSANTIADVPPVKGELPIALVMHYSIGITLTLVFAALLRISGIHPSRAGGFALAFGFGLLTNLLPWLWMFPSMGYGTFGRAAPPELMLLRSSFVNHVIFALGLAIWTTCLGLLT